jgi:hypothetical protein
MSNSKMQIPDNINIMNTNFNFNHNLKENEIKMTEENKLYFSPKNYTNKKKSDNEFSSPSK